MNRILIAIFMLVITANSICRGQTKNRWNVYAGGSISHLCETPFAGTDKNYGWGGGAFIGGGYEINYTPHWSLTPRLEFSFDNNGGTLSSKNESFFNNHARWENYWSVSIPINVSYRFSVSDNIGLRIGVGPYLQTVMSGKKYVGIHDSETMVSTVKKESLSGTFDQRFNIGAAGEIVIETKNHLSYGLRVKYPLIKRGWLMNTLTLSVGVGYSL
ncbi:MAG: outer membrane beta-barrel protein [Muribaculaceae bacterium]|nr:outer membrane beta-barrel protein [Muribaculaceae bacterium]